MNLIYSMKDYTPCIDVDYNRMIITIIKTEKQ